MNVSHNGLSGSIDSLVSPLLISVDFSHNRFSENMGMMSLSKNVTCDMSGVAFECPVTWQSYEQCSARYVKRLSVLNSSGALSHPYHLQISLCVWKDSWHPSMRRIFWHHLQQQSTSPNPDWVFSRYVLGGRLINLFISQDHRSILQCDCRSHCGKSSYK